MIAQLRVYQENSVQIVPLADKRQFTVGETAQCDLQLSPGCCSGQAVFLPDGGRWRARIPDGSGTKDVWMGNGDIVCLNSALNLRVQLILQEDQCIAQIPLSGQELSIGRRPGNTLQLNHPRVSGSHAKIEATGSGQWKITDLKSTNGLYINTQRIREKTLQDGDQILIGPFTLNYSSGKLLIHGEKTLIHSQQIQPVQQSKQSQPEQPVRKRYPNFIRSPRTTDPVPEGTLEIEAAPSIGEKPVINWFTTLLPSLGGVLGMAIVTMISGMNPMSLMISLPMAVIGVITTVVNYNNGKNKFEQQDSKRRQQYEEYLSQCEATLKKMGEEQRKIALFSNPPLETCLKIVQNMDRRLWVRSASDSDFVSARVGLGIEPLRYGVTVPRLSAMSMNSDEFTDRPAKLKQQYSQVHDVPVTVDLLHQPHLGVVGSRTQAIDAVRTLVVQLTTSHCYEDLKLVVLFSPQEKEQWEWMRWLPHTFSPDRKVRYMASSVADASRMLDTIYQEMKQRKKNQDPFAREQVALPHYVFLMAEPKLLQGSALYGALGELNGVSTVWLAPSISSLPQCTCQVLQVGSHAQLYQLSQVSDRTEFACDGIPLEQCRTFARSMAPIRLPRQGENTLPECVTFLEGYHVQNVQDLDLGENWRNARCEKTLSVPIAVRENGEHYYFDIHESFDGPHGLVAGTSGSGKSEMAQTWIASMALQFSPRDVNFILVDFKGTSLLQPFRNLPHLAGSISNLDKDIRRCLVALESEMNRRQMLLDRYGCSDILSYQKKHRQDDSMDEMPFLILVIDEFADFKVQFPDFTSALDHVFRGGRSLGVYTMIMTQKPSGVVTEQMNSNANFRWCLRVQSETDSRDMINTGAAAYLSAPGRSYVKTGSTALEMVQPFYSGAAYCPDAADQEIPAVCEVRLNGECHPLYRTETAGKSHIKQIDAVVKHVADYCRSSGIAPARQLWTDPLPDLVDLAEILPDGTLWQGVQQWNPEDPTPAAVIGLVDDPANQAQMVLSHNFWEKGHLVLYGMPLSGKTTFLQTLMLSLCCTHTPEQVQFYMIEFGGFGLRSLETFPHVGGAAGDDEPQEMQHILTYLTEEIGRRKQLFRQEGVGTLSAYLDASGKKLSSLILLADNLNLADTDFPEVTDAVTQLSREGEAYGIYVAATIAGSSGLNYRMSQNFKTVMTLQLTDRMDYNSLVGRVHDGIPKAVIGRGLVSGPLEFQTAFPLKTLSDGKRIAAVRKIAEQMRSQWTGALPCYAGKPQKIPFGSIQAEPLILGVDSKNQQPVSLPLTDNTSILLSCGDEQIKQELLDLLLDQAVDIPDITLILCGCQRTVSGAISVQWSEMLQTMQNLMPELRRRQMQIRAEPGCRFAPVVIFADHLDSGMETAENNTISQLEAFARLGADLGITVIGADLAAQVSHTYFSKNILLETMMEGAVILAGGQTFDHQIVDTAALKQVTPNELPAEELVLMKNGNFRRIRRMSPRTES